MDEGLSWREEGAYRHLVPADRSIFAWEWLRRDLSYRGSSPADAVSYGLHRWIDPRVGAPEARPVWAFNSSPYVLRCHAAPPGRRDDPFLLGELGPLATLVESPVGEHLLISDGLAAIRLDIVSGSLRAGPAALRYEISGLGSASAPLLTLRRFLVLARTGSFCMALHRPERRAQRFIRELRVFDALAAGASQREIAAVLFGRLTGETRWRSQSPSVRLQVQRLVRRAHVMGAGGYRRLLLPPR